MISQTAEYALRAVTHLAAQGADETPNTAQVSQATQVPSNYLAKVLRGLARAGLVRSQRGRHGGHTLARDPRQLTVLDVVNVVDPLPRIRSCPLGLNRHPQLCPLCRRLDSAVALVEDAFGQTTIAQLVPGAADHKCCLFPQVPRGGRKEQQQTVN